MGWWGVVFKPDIASISDHLAIGLTTGYLGSLTTFSGWNQKMLDLIIDGHWVFAVVGFLVGDAPCISKCYAFAPINMRLLQNTIS